MGEVSDQAKAKLAQMDKRWEQIKSSIDSLVEKVNPVEVIPTLQAQVGEDQVAISQMMEQLRLTGLAMEKISCAPTGTAK